MATQCNYSKKNKTKKRSWFLWTDMQELQDSVCLFPLKKHRRENQKQTKCYLQRVIEQNETEQIDWTPKCTFLYVFTYGTFVYASHFQTLILNRWWRENRLFSGIFNDAQREAPCVKSGLLMTETPCNLNPKLDPTLFSQSSQKIPPCSITSPTQAIRLSWTKIPNWY